jgi:ankyrin repeat protein
MIARTNWKALALTGLCTLILQVGCEKAGSENANSSTPTADATPASTERTETAKSSTGNTSNMADKTVNKLAQDTDANQPGSRTAREPVKDPQKNINGEKTEFTRELPNPGSRGAAAMDPTISKENQSKSAPSVSNIEAFVAVVPDNYDLGDVATNDTARGKVTLVNNGDVAVVLDKPKTNCGCTAAGLKRGTRLEPGQEIEVDISLRASHTPHKINKMVTFTFMPPESHPPLRLPVSCTAIAYVDAQPRTVNRTNTPEPKVRLFSIDDEPFRITSMVPGLVEEFPEEASTSHEIAFSWEDLDEITSARPTRQLIFYTDHSKCNRVQVMLVNNRAVAKRDDDGVTRINVDPDNPGTDRPLITTKPTKPVTPPSVTAFQNIVAGNAEALKTALEKGLDLESIDDKGMTLLGAAAIQGQTEIVQMLLDAGAELEATDRLGRTPLMHAAHGDHPELIRLLIEAGSDLTARDTLGGTALSWAATRGSHRTVQELVDNGARADIVGTMTGFTPLIWCAGFEGDPKSVAILLEAGADLESEDLIQGATPLIHASRQGNATMVTTLIEAGAQLEHADRMGLTPLLACAQNGGGTVDKLKVLIDAGADLTATESRGRNALQLARDRTDARAEEVYTYLTKVFEEHGLLDEETTGDNAPAEGGESSDS